MKAFKIDRKYKHWAGQESKKGRHEKRKKRASAIFLTPSILGVLMFFIIPFIVVIVYSMVDNPINMEFVGFNNFLRVMNNGAFKKAVFNTIRFSLIAVPLAVVLSLLLAVVLEWKIPFSAQTTGMTAAEGTRPMARLQTVAPQRPVPIMKRGLTLEPMIT